MAPNNAPHKSTILLPTKYLRVTNIIKYKTDAADAVKKGLFLSIIARFIDLIQ